MAPQAGYSARRQEVGAIGNHVDAVTEFLSTGFRADSRSRGGQVERVSLQTGQPAGDAAHGDVQDSAGAGRSRRVRRANRPQQTDSQKGARPTAIGTCLLKTNLRYRDLDAPVDYREYDGEWTAWFEEHWFKPRLRNLEYEHVRFFVARRVSMTAAFGNESAN